jgi:hypothetical protein
MAVWKGTTPIEEGARYVRKYLYLAMTAASVAMLVAPVAASASTAAGSSVLTISKAGGAAVKTGAVLKASLAKKSTAVFTTSLFSLDCKTAAFSAKVTKNPKAKGTATESLTKQTIGKCTVKGIGGITVKSITANNLPYNVTVSDSKGNPVTVKGTKKSKPIETTVSVVFGGKTYTCLYKATTLKASASNKGNSITMTKQSFTFVSGSSLCPETSTFSVTFGPVTDSSVKKSPAVFVN